MWQRRPAKIEITEIGPVKKMKIAFVEVLKERTKMNKLKSFLLRIEKDLR